MVLQAPLVLRVSQAQMESQDRMDRMAKMLLTLSLLAVFSAGRVREGRQEPEGAQAPVDLAACEGPKVSLDSLAAMADLAAVDAQDLRAIGDLRAGPDLKGSRDWTPSKSSEEPGLRCVQAFLPFHKKIK